jgi:hypothetical protein
MPGSNATGGCAMLIDSSPDEIRTLVYQTFLEFDVSEETLDDMNETMLIDDGRYMARSYRLDDYMAMWLIEAGLVQFYDAAGNMLRTVRLFDEFEPQRLAA